MIKNVQGGSENYQVLDVSAESIEEMRFGINQIAMPFLERNQLGNYFKQYPELKDMGFEGCKKKLSEGIDHILAETQKHSKPITNPSQSRSRYVELQKWLITHLQSLQEPQMHKQLSTLEYIDQQKKLIISAFLELQQLFSSECRQKSQILKLITTLSLQIINTLLIELQNTSSKMLIGYLKEKNTSEKDLIERISSLEKTIEILEKEKNNKWKNLYIVVKDNRVMKKQNNKLLKMLNSEQEKVRILNEQHLKTKDENQKFKLFLSSDKQEQTTKLSRYVQAKVQINQIDRLIKLYPKQAQKIAYAELKNIQKSELNTLEQKISHIIKTIEKSGELVHEKDDADDFLDTKKSKMCFNISIQTEIMTHDFGTNTLIKHTFSKQTQVCQNLKSNNLDFAKKVICQEIKPSQRKHAQSIDKKKPKPSMAYLNKHSVHNNNSKQNSKDESGKEGSIRNMVSTKKVKNNDDFLIFRTVNFRYLPDAKSAAFLKKKPSLYKRKESFSDSEISQSQESQLVKKQKSVHFESTSQQRKSRDISDTNIKSNDSRMKAIKGKQKRAARFQNLHTFSSKSKMKDYKHVESELWKVSKCYNLSIHEIFKFCQNVFISTAEDRVLNRKTSSMSGYNRNSSNNHKNFLTTFPGAALKSFHEQKWQDENQSQNTIDKQEQALQKTKHFHEAKAPEAINIVNRKIYRASKDRIENISLELKKNPVKPSNLSNEAKVVQKKSSTMKTAIPKLSVNRRERHESQESMQSISRQIYDNRYSFQKDVQEDLSRNNSLLRQLDNKQIVKRSSQFSKFGMNSTVLKAKKYNRQNSVLLNRLKNPNMRLMTQMGQKRDSQISFVSGIQDIKHLRTKTQGIDQIDETAEEQTTTFKHLRGSVERIKDLAQIYKESSEVQDEFEQTFKPKNKFTFITENDLQISEPVDVNRYDSEDEASLMDLVKSIERVVKNISQRSVQIIKKEYLFKEFLLSFYQLNYGNGKENIPKSYVQFLIELKRSRFYSSNPLAQCMYLLMNETYSEVYRREIFKLFTIFIDRNAGSLSDSSGEHHLYKKIMNELLSIFIEPSQVPTIIKPMCLQQLNSSLPDYFIAIEGEIKKRSINSELYAFMINHVLQFGDTTVSFEIIKEITFFLALGNKKVKNQLIELRMYSEPFIELHRLCLVAGKLKFSEFLQIGTLLEKKFIEIKKQTGLNLTPNTMMNSLAKQKFDNFPYLKLVFHRQIQFFYKFNAPISEVLLKLCHVNLLCQKLQNESPVSDCLKAINEQTEKLQRLKYYKQILEKNEK